MLSHSSIWDAIDALAKRNGLSPSGLARLAGLDSTAFNKSKRVSKDGRERWPSTESIAKILDATGEGFDTFMTGETVYSRNTGMSANHTVPLIGFAEAGEKGRFDENGLPVGGKWDRVVLPPSDTGDSYALEVSGDNMLPLYRDGDILIVSPKAQMRRGDRVVIRLKKGGILARTLYRQTATQIELRGLSDNDEQLSFDLDDVDSVARILWAGQ